MVQSRVYYVSPRRYRKVDHGDLEDIIIGVSGPLKLQNACSRINGGINTRNGINNPTPHPNALVRR